MTSDSIACPADVAGLVALLETRDRTLVVACPSLAERRQWRSVLWHGLNEGGLPVGTRLRYQGRDGGDLTIRLVDDTEENTPTVKQPAPAVPVPAMMPRRLHPAVQATRAVVRPDRDGWVSTRHHPGVVHVYASKSELPRVWRTLHTLFREAERRGFQVGVGKDRYRSDCGVGVVIDGTAIEVAVSERQQKVPHVETAAERDRAERWGFESRVRSDLIATGLLRVTVGHTDPRVLAGDGARWRIEDRVGAMLERLDVVAAERVEQERRRQIAQVEQAARHEVLRERQRLADIDVHQVKQLMVRVAAHADAERIRDYLRAAAGVRPELTDDEGAWLAWAHAYADRIDSVDEPLAFPRVPSQLEAT